MTIATVETETVVMEMMVGKGDDNGAGVGDVLVKTVMQVMMVVMMIMTLVVIVLVMTARMQTALVMSW